MSKRSFDQIDGPKLTQPLKIERVEQEESSIYEITSWLCSDVWSNIVEFCDTKEWLQLSYTCKGINRFKFNRLLMSNKVRKLQGTLNKKEIKHWFRLGRGTLFNVHLNKNNCVEDDHFLIHEMVMPWLSKDGDLPCL